MIYSPISWHLSGGMARIGGASFKALHLLRPRHRQRAGQSVGTVVQLNGDGLDPAHGLVAVAAAGPRPGPAGWGAGGAAGGHPSSSGTQAA
jgi:hypothetical protein